MRKTLLAGLVLAVATLVVVWLSRTFGLELESAALLGVAVGAVVALVPDRTLVWRLAGFAGGVGAAWVGYLLRAGYLPDSTAGRAVVLVLVIALCTLVALTKAPLWSALLGAAALAGAYEFTYKAAPPEVMATSLGAATSLLFCAAVGLLAAVLAAGPSESGQHAPVHRGRPVHDDDTTARLDEMMMEKAK